MLPKQNINKETSNTIYAILVFLYKLNTFNNKGYLDTTSKTSFLSPKYITKTYTNIFKTHTPKATEQQCLRLRYHNTITINLELAGINQTHH